MDFNESVRVIWPGEVSGVVARAVNLSLAGIRIDAPTPTPCAVGSDVLCDVTLPRGPRLLRGRVAHRRLLSSAKVGMGIEFVDLSPRELAELRDVVGESAEGVGPNPQRVKVRFEGTNQVVSARAFPTEAGFRLATALPFLKPETEVDIALAGDVGANVRGWVSAVALQRTEPGGTPRLVIDVHVDEHESWIEAPAERPITLSSVPLDADDTPKVEAVPEHVWEPETLRADGVDDLAAAAARARAVALDDPDVPTIVDPSPTLPRIVSGGASAPVVQVPRDVDVDVGAAPVGNDEGDLTEIVSLPPRRSSRWRALGGGMLAGAVALAAFVAALVLMRSSAPKPGEPVIAAAPTAPPAAVEPAPAAPPPAAPAAVAAAPAPVAAPEAPQAAPAPTEDEPPAPAVSFSVGLEGSLAGAQRYPLRNPDGVAFNLPHAKATMKLGTYFPPVRGLKAVWVRALPTGGAHLRFFFSSARPAPRVELGRDAVVVTSP